MKYLGLDIGTTGVKATVFDSAGNMVGYAMRSYPIEFGPDQYAEQDPLLVWIRCKEAMASACRDCGHEICAISISVQGDAIVPVDHNFTPLHPFILGMDYRSALQAQQFEDKFGARHLFDLTGMRPHPLNSITKIKWLVDNRPDIHDRTRKYMTYGDFVLRLLGADAPTIDITMASRTMAFDIKRQAWFQEAVDFSGCLIEQLSDICNSGSIVGRISKNLAEELGINQTALIVAGGHDQPCAALGAGMTRNNGLALDSHGTAEVLSAAFDIPLLNDCMFSGYYPCTFSAQPNRYFTFALNHTGGVLLQWFKNEFCESDIRRAEALHVDPYTYMISQAPMNRPSRVLALPHFNGSGTPHCHLDTKGAFVGLDMNTDRAELTKAIMEGLAYEIKLNMLTLREANVPIERIRCVGGAAKSEAWLQMKADILGIELETLKTSEAAGLGAAMIAAVAAGEFNDLSQASDAMVHVRHTYTPNTSLNLQYTEIFSLYRQLYYTLLPVNHMLWKTNKL